MAPLLQIITARLKEPSTYAGLSALLLALGLKVDPGVLHALLTGAIWACAGLAMVMSEAGKKTPAQIALDAIAAARKSTGG